MIALGGRDGETDLYWNGRNMYCSRPFRYHLGVGGWGEHGPSCYGVVLLSGYTYKNTVQLAKSISLSNSWSYSFSEIWTSTRSTKLDSVAWGARRHNRSMVILCFYPDKNNAVACFVYPDKNTKLSCTDRNEQHIILLCAFCYPDTDTKIPCN